MCKLPHACGQSYTTFSCANIDGIAYCSCPTGFYNDTTELDCVLANVTYSANVTLSNASFTSELNNPSSAEFIKQASSFCDQVKLLANMLNYTKSNYLKMLDIYRKYTDVASCSVNRFLKGSIIVDYVLGFSSSNNFNLTSLDELLVEYTSNCSGNCFGMNSSASFSGYQGRIFDVFISQSTQNKLHYMNNV